MAEFRARIADLDVNLVLESGGDDLGGSLFAGAGGSDALCHRHGGGTGHSAQRPRVTRSDFLVVNKIDLAPHVGVDPVQLEADARAARGTRPFVMASLRQGRGVAEVVEFLKEAGGL